jgi:aminopeptidase N
MMSLRSAGPALLLAAIALALVVIDDGVGARRLPSNTVPEHYDLRFVVDIPGKRFDGTETIRVRISEPTTRIVLNAAEITFQEVTIGSGSTAQRATVTLDAEAETATLTVARPIDRGATDIHIAYSGVLNDKLRGFYISRGDARSYAVTQFESTDARRAFPSFDEPAYKATFDVTLTVDRGDTAISNGRVIADTPGPGAGQHTIKFSRSPKMSSYLVAMAVGDFECLEGGVDGTPIRICTTPGKTRQAQIALDTAQEVLRFYNEYYEIGYPFGKLDMLAVPDFAAGAMENTGAIFYRETALLADSATASVNTRKNIAATIAHEVAHQWFGDLVTMQWWDDLWLNEGFATWMETRPLARSNPEWHVDVDEARDNQAALNLDSLRATRPIHSPVRTPAEIESLFDAISYQKGGAVLRMIEQYVGPDAFRKGINAYLAAHAYGNATSQDFWTAIARSSGKPVDRILPTFINQAGAPLLKVSAPTCTTDGKTRVTFAQERFVIGSTTAAASNTTWQLPACLKTGSSPASSTCVIVSEPETTMDVAESCTPWIFANAGAQGYYRTEYAPDTLRALAPHVATLTAPERLTLVDDEWAMVRAARHAAADYLTLAAAYGRESSSGVLAEVTERLAFIHQYLTTDSSRDPFEQFVRTLLHPLLEELGFSPSGGEDDDRRALRAVLVDAIGRVGRDPDVVRQARAALDRSLAGGAAIDPTVRDSIVHIAAANGDARLYDALVAASTQAKSPGERTLYLFAPADFRDPVLIDRALARALTTEIRTQDTARYLAAFFDNPVARPRAWSFIKSNWGVLEPKMRTFNAGAVLARAASAFCDAQSRDDVRTFIGSRRLPGSTGALNQTIERINNCIDLREQQTASVTSWLASR